MREKNTIRPHGASEGPIRSRMLQRTCSCGANSSGQGECEQCKKNNLNVQRAAVDGATAPAIAPRIVHDALRSPGQPLDKDTRAFMEPRLGHDFSRVRVHTDAQAGESARAVSALAYTVGHDVFFDPRNYQPGTTNGLRLMAHELAHVVQQSGAAPSANSELVVGEPGSASEREADNVVKGLVERDAVSSARHMLNTANYQAQRSILQRQLDIGLSPIHTATDTVDIGPTEDVASGKPKLQRLADEFKKLATANPSAYIHLSSHLSKDSELSSAKAAEERGRVFQHMQAVRDALVGLGVPSGSITIDAPAAFSTTSGGVITVDLYSAPRALPPMPGGPPRVTPSLPPPARTTPSPSLSDLLTFKFSAGGVQFTAELPSSISAKLPVPLSAAITLSFELKAESSLDFSFSVTLDGLPHLKFVAKASVHYDKDKQSASGGASVEFQATKTTCSASDPETLKAKIKSAGDKLKTAMDQLGSVPADQRIGKLTEIAGAIADMYDAVDKSKSACKQTPVVTFGFGAQGPLTTESDPSKRTPGYIGGTITIPF